MLCGAQQVAGKDILPLMDESQERGCHEFFLLPLLKYQTDGHVELGTRRYLGDHMSAVLCQGGAERELLAFQQIMEDLFLWEQVGGPPVRCVKGEAMLQ